jgi:hypothetical protein
VERIISGLKGWIPDFLKADSIVEGLKHLTVTGGRRSERRIGIGVRWIGYRANYGLKANLNVGPINRT